MKITTRYVEATDTRGARVIATHVDEFDGSTKTASMAYDYALNGFDNHHKVAKILQQRLLGYVDMYRGNETKTGRGYRFFTGYGEEDWGEELKLCS